MGSDLNPLEQGGTSGQSLEESGSCELSGLGAELARNRSFGCVTLTSAVGSLFLLAGTLLPGPLVPSATGGWYEAGPLSGVMAARDTDPLGFAENGVGAFMLGVPETGE